MTTIYEIHQGIRDLLETVDPETGEISEEVMEAYGNLQEDLNVKQKNTLLYYRHLASQEAAIKAEIDRLKALRDSKKRQMEGVEKLVRYTMDNTGARKLDYDIVKAQYRATKRVIIDDEAQLQKEFIKEKVTYSPDKTAIKKAVEAGESVPGAHVEEYNSLSIK